MTVVLGAGCSVEEPTALPLTGDLAEQIHARLVADGVLEAGECLAPRDLTAVADTVYAKLGFQQAVIDRMPLARMRNAAPNDGYILLAALLVEGAVLAAVTLNYDLAIEHALSRVDAREQVYVICAPEDYRRLGQRNVVYLHRNVNCLPEAWIIRSVQLGEDWKDGWEAIVADRMLASPMTVFAGLGSPAAVLVETTRRIAKVLSDHGVRPFMVDPTDYASSSFAVSLGIPPERYMQMGWSSFMRALADRLVVAHLGRLRSACEDLTASQHLQNEDFEPSLSRLGALGLIALGSVRSAWMLRQSPYTRSFDMAWELQADLVLAVTSVERRLHVTGHFDLDGCVTFMSDTRRARLLLATGRGVERWAAMDARVRQFLKGRRSGQTVDPIRAVLVGGVSGGRVDLTPPEDLTGDGDPLSVVGGSITRLITVDEIRENADLARELIA
jgi:hypothetical protein